MDQQAKTKLIEAENLFHNAKEELCKPIEDVVTYGVCRSSYYAVINYLRSFLLSQDDIVSESSSIEDLLNGCRSIDAKFNDLHLTPLYNPTQTEDVWMNLDTARDYLVMAESTRQLVIQRSNIS